MPTKSGGLEIQRQDQPTPQRRSEGWPSFLMRRPIKFYYFCGELRKIRISIKHTVMGIKKPDFLSIREYLDFEYAAQNKHEYDRGEIFAMSGGTINHGVLCGNAYNELRKNIEADNIKCRTFGSEIRIHIKPADSIVYPDAMVVCGDLEISEEDKEAIINPILIVEVLSKSTESYDRGDKFYKYRQLESFKEYILADQEKAVVETFFKRDANIWEISRISGLDQVITIKSLGIKIKMSELYLDIYWKNQDKR